MQNELEPEVLCDKTLLLKTDFLQFSLNTSSSNCTTDAVPVQVDVTRLHLAALSGLLIG